MSEITGWNDINKGMDGEFINRMTPIVGVLLDAYSYGGNGDNPYQMRLWVLSEVLDELPENDTEAGNFLVKMVQMENYE